VLFSPLVLVSGLYQIYQSNVWTLVYREITHPQAAPQVQPAAAIDPIQPV
jgi:hypothetical protein